MFLFSVSFFRINGALSASCMGYRRAFPGEWQKAYDLDYPTPSSAWLRKGRSVPPIHLITSVPYYRMMFDIDYDEDSYYLKRGSHARF